MASTTGQYGMIISLSEAMTLFGEVTKSFSVETKFLLECCSQTQTVLMFGEAENTLVIAGNNRMVLLPQGFQLAASIVMHTFDKNIINELLSLGGSQVTEIEFRSTVLDLKNGETVLEFGWPCPPYCD